ncbi:ABC transporter permease [Microbacterium kribbense]|uniref:ABC transporter permease n=1 Tax=Microbacterium kribbense TaxID=433645 RepID=A0ABP7G475_9MICO
MNESTRTRTLLVRLLTICWLPVLLVAAWFVVSANSTDVFWPPLATILDELVTSFTAGTMWSDLGYSFTNYFAGLAIALVVAMAIGILVGEVTVLHKTLMPFLDFARATPHVSFVPIIILGFGIGAGPKIFLIAFACLWPILLNTIDGIRAVPASVHESARAFRIPLHLRILKVTLPGALPQIVVGVRIAISVGVVMLIVSEMFGADRGIGYFIVDTGANFAIASTWAGVILIGLIGYLLSQAFSLLENRLLRWHRQFVPSGKTKASSPLPGSDSASLASALN